MAVLVFRVAELKKALNECGLSARPPKSAMQERLQRHLKMVNGDALAQAALYALRRQRIPGRLLPMPSVHDAVEAAARTCPKIPHSSCLLNQASWDSLAGNQPGQGTGRSLEGSMPAGWAKFRCVCSAPPSKLTNACGRPLEADPSLKQCAGGCGTYFHKKCMGLKTRFCELCRLRTVDPFWETVAEPSLCLDVRTAKIEKRERDPRTPWSVPPPSATRSFKLTSNQKSLLASSLGTDRNQAFRLRVACFLLEDSVEHRVHWPLGAELIVNGYRISCYGRWANQPLGPHGRDVCIDISSYCRVGLNTVALKAMQELAPRKRDFVMVVQMVRRIPLEEVERSLRARCEPTSGVGHDFGVARAKKVLGVTGGGGDDDDVVATSAIVPLRCPLSAQRIQTPTRSRTCSHLKVFDMHSFLLMNVRSQKWQCPFCMGSAHVDDLEVDVFLKRVLGILEKLQGGDKVDEVEVRPSDMAWRAYYGKLQGSGKWVAVGEVPGPDILIPEEGATAPPAKPEPAGDPPPGAGVTAEPSESSELSEREEMRRAVAAARGLKRPRPVPVIDLSDSEEAQGPQEFPPVPARGATAPAARPQQEARPALATYLPSQHAHQLRPNRPPTAPQPPLRAPAAFPRQRLDDASASCDHPVPGRTMRADIAGAARAGAGTASDPLDL